MENPAGCLKQLLPGALLLQQYRRAACRLQHPGIFLLVIVGDIGRRHNQGRNSQRRQLTDGGGARPADHQVRSPHHRCHIINILPQLQRRMSSQVHALFLQKSTHHRIAAAACTVNVMKRLLCCLQGQEIRHLTVHAGSSQRAPEGHNQRPLILQPQPSPGLLLGHGKEIFPHRRTRDQHPVGMMIMLPAGFKSHQDTISIGLQHPGGQARRHIGLMYRRGNPCLGCRLHNGKAGVSAGTHHHIR